MGALEQVTQMRQRNMSDSEIISELRKQNISPREINEALNHAQIKDAVSDIRGDENLEAPMPSGGQYGNEGYGQQQGGADYGQQQQAQDYGQGYDQNQTYAAQPQAYYPQQQGYGDYQQPAAVNTDTIVEVSEQVFNEKISEFSKRIDSVDEFKALTQAKLESMNERLKRIEAIMDKMQSSILEKVGSYGSNLDSIKKEMSMMQDTFVKVAEGKRGKSSGEDSEEKISRKKK